MLNRKKQYWREEDYWIEPRISLLIKHRDNIASNGAIIAITSYDLRDQRLKR